MSATPVSKFDDFKDVKYVAVKVSLRASKGCHSEGYFLGIRPISEYDMGVSTPNDMYVWIYCKDVLHIYNIEQYTIDSILMGLGEKGDVSSTQGYPESEDSQKKAVEKLTNIYDSFTSRKMVKPNGLIDHSKFTFVPIALCKAVELEDNISNNSSTYTPKSPLYQDRAAACGYRGNANTTTYTTPIRKESSTMSFKRTTRYDVAAAVELLYSKIKSIVDGTYVSPKLKRIPADDKDSTVENNANQLSDDEMDELEDAFNGICC